MTAQKDRQTTMENRMIHITYAEIVAFFKANPAIWYTIQRMMADPEGNVHLRMPEPIMPEPGGDTMTVYNWSEQNKDDGRC